MKMAVFYAFSLYLIIQFSQAQADCMLRESPPSFQNYIAGDEDSPITKISLQHQAIMPGYKFVCDQTTCGNITEWGVDVNPGRGQHQMAYTLDLQVWRPSPTVDDSTGTGCYSLVGNNRFTSVSLSNGVAVVTPSPQNYIQFQPGDVLGFYVEEARQASDGVVLVVGDNFARNTVWYASIAPSMATSQTGSCPYSVGSNGILSTATRGIAPVISIKTETYSCSTSQVAPTFTTLEPTPLTLPPGGAGNIITITGVNSNIPIPITSEENTDDPVQDSSRSGASTPLLISVIVASASGVVFIMLLVVACATAIIKRQKKKMNGYVIDRGVAISNEVYMNRHSAEFDTTYEYVDSPPKPSAKTETSVKFNTASEKISTDPPLTHFSEERVTHVRYYDEGPNASKPPELPARTRVGVHRPEKSANMINSVCHYAETKLANGEQNVYAGDPTAGDPTLSGSFACSQRSQSSSQADVFDSAGVYVPTVEERATWEGHYVMQETRMYHKLKFFDEDKVYWAPASTTSDLYIQLASKKYREIPRTQIRISSQLGSGQFGEVCKAVWSISGTTKQLAIKTLKPSSKEEEKVRFLQEAAIMGQFCHPNVVRLYGVVTVGDPVMICLELMANGDLRDYLMSISPRSQNSRTLEIQFLRFSKQIASGMNHLASKSFIHRDLAARNILLDETLTCKVGDFGMARDLMDDTYYTATRGAKIPIKWTAPEALLYKKYSTNSDIWSYGMVLFEIWSVGKKPFSQFTNSEVVRQINTGYNQPPPPGCPRAIYQLMVDCWHPEHYQRPPFSSIIHYLSTSKELLFQWIEEADMVSSRVKELGAPLSEAESLYKDLQNAYINTIASNNTLV